MSLFENSRFRIRPDGTVPITCRKCGREISRRAVQGNLTFTTVSECLICQGYPEDVVLQQYVMSDPTKPPVPISEVDPVNFYPEDANAKDVKTKTWAGVLRPLFRALGWAEEEEPEEMPESVKIAKRKRAKGLFEK